MTDQAKCQRLARVVAGAKLIGWDVTTPTAGQLRPIHEKGGATLSWPNPADDAQENALLAILRTPVPAPPRSEAQAEAGREFAVRRAERVAGRLTIDRGLSWRRTDMA
jgi:hypothetical protein